MPQARDAPSRDRPLQRRGTLSILHLTAPAPFGGLERVVRALATGHAAAGHRVSVAAVLAEEAPHPFVEGFRATRVDVHRVVLPGRSYSSERRRIAEIIDGLRPDVVHTHGYRADVMGWLTARGRGVPVVATAHGFTGGGWRNRAYERLQRGAFRGFQGVVAVSRPLVERLVEAGVARERVHLVPNAWSPGSPGAAGAREAVRARLDVPPGSFVIGWVGRLSREKGPDLLLDALDRLGDVPFTAVIVGDGPERASLEARARRSALRDRIVWTGRVEGAEQLFPAFDAFVLSSRTEGTPIVLFEAMAASVPIVAAEVGGVPDVLSGAEALLVRRESGDALARAIRALRADPDATARRARAAHVRLLAQYDVDPWLSRYETIYRAVLPRARRKDDA